MNKPKVILIGVARPGFDIDLASSLYSESVRYLSGIASEVQHPEVLITDPDEAARVANSYRDSGADALVIQLSTFVDGRFSASIVGELDLPTLLWGIPEPGTHGRLRLNSLTGLNAASYTLNHLGRKYRYVYRSPGEPAVIEIGAWLRSAALSRRLRSAKIGVVGDHPPGFFASSVDPLELRRVVGPTLVSLALEPLLQEAAQIPDAVVVPQIESDRSTVSNLDRLDPAQVKRSTQFHAVLSDKVKTLGLSAVAVRCWPEFFNSYQAVACSTLAHLNDSGIPAACEADVLGAVSMLIHHHLSEQAVFLGDMVYMNEPRNSVTFWHCGAGAFSLASPKTGACAGVQPNRNLGFALDNRLKAGVVTISRLGRTEDGFRMFVTKGEALDELEQFKGTSVEVRFQRPVKELLDIVINGGFEFHFAIAWADVIPEIEHLCALLDLPLTVF